MMKYKQAYEFLMEYLLEVLDIDSTHRRIISGEMDVIFGERRCC
jgi:hypothetical protein